MEVEALVAGGAHDGEPPVGPVRFGCLDLLDPVVDVGAVREDPELEKAQSPVGVVAALGMLGAAGAERHDLHATGSELASVSERGVMPAAAFYDPGQRLDVAVGVHRPDAAGYEQVVGEHPEWPDTVPHRVPVRTKTEVPPRLVPAAGFSGDVGVTADEIWNASAHRGERDDRRRVTSRPTSSARSGRSR